MAKILLTDDGIEFDGTTPDRKPLGGAESAAIALVEALAARGHHVSVRNRCAAPLTHKNVDWAPRPSRLSISISPTATPPFCVRPSMPNRASSGFTTLRASSKRRAISFPSH